MLGAANRVARFLLPDSLYQRCRRAIVSRLVANYETRTVSHVYCGFPLRISLEDRVAEEWYDRDWPRSRELDKLSLQPRELVFNLGAHQAIVAMVASRIVGGRGRVIAVEAEPHNVLVARANVALNAADNVEVLHAAVTSVPGHVRFAEGLNGRLMEGGRVALSTCPR